jgi:cold shock protein
LHVRQSKVDWFKDAIGFGFIVADDGVLDLFVHHSEIKSSGYSSLSEGQAVDYVVGQGKTGQELLPDDTIKAATQP